MLASSLLTTALYGAGLLLALGFIILAVFVAIGIVLEVAWRRQRRPVPPQVCVICQINRSKEGHHV